MIFVTGCARSGTSLVTKILKAHGCYLGRENRINRLYENLSIRENVLKSYLMRIDADPLGQSVLPDTNNLAPMPRLRELVEDYLADGPKPWAYKDAKLTLVWPVFHYGFADAKWILVRRSKDKIVESCVRTLFMHKRNKSGWSAWVDEHERRFADMRMKLDLVEVWTDDVVRDPHAFRPVAEHCGLTFNLGAVTRAIDARLWHAADAEPPRTHMAERARRQSVTSKGAHHARPRTV